MNTSAKRCMVIRETEDDISRFPDHNSLGLTNEYIRRLKGKRDRSWAKVTQVIDV